MTAERILVTGATGVLGRRVLPLLAPVMDRCRILVRRPERLGPEAAAAEIRQGDLTRPESIRGCCEGIDTVLHMASHSQAENRGDEEHPGHWEVTARGTEALGAEAARAGVRRFIFLSSIHAIAPAPQAGGVRAMSLYGRAKAAAEERLDHLARLTGMELQILRLSPLYGEPGVGRLPELVCRIARGRLPRLPAGGVRPMVHVADAAALVAAQVRGEGWRKGCFVVAEPGGVDLRALQEEVRERVLARTGRRPPAPPVPLLAWRLLARAGDLLALAGGHPPLDSAMLARLRSELPRAGADAFSSLGFRPQHSLSAALDGLIESCLEPGK